MVKVKDIEQGSDEWLALRVGIPTASNFDKIVTTKGERSKQRNKYLYQLAGEVVTGEPKDGYKNANMERGNEREDESRKLYEFTLDLKVEQVGFIYFNDKKLFGCSPDGLVGEDGGFETKDALPHIHLDRLENGWSKAQYFQQVQGSLYVTGRKWWDLVSYSRGFKPVVIRYEPDSVFINSLKIELFSFVMDLKSVVKKYGI